MTAKHVAVPLHGLDVFIQAIDKNGDATKIDASHVIWHDHPDKDVDVSVAPVGVVGELNVATLATNIFVKPSSLNQHGLGIGDEVLIPGLFTRLTDTLEPIVRTGSLAMTPKGKVITAGILPGRHVPMEGYLIDQRSLGGMSGSPVFIRETVNGGSDKTWADGKTRPFLGMGAFFLLGLMHGHWKVDPADAHLPFPSAGDIPIGMSIVVPAEKILEAINQPVLADERDLVISEDGRKNNKY